MDYFAHILITYLVFHKTKRPWVAAAFGVLPDTLSWVPYMFYRMFTWQFAQPVWTETPAWVFTLYGISHSILLAGIVILAVYLILGRVPWFVFGYPFHILIDIPTHSADFLPTPFLWPISDYQFPGLAWSTPWFMVLTYVGIISGFAWLWWKKSSGQKRIVHKNQHSLRRQL